MAPTGRSQAMIRAIPLIIAAYHHRGSAVARGRAQRRRLLPSPGQRATSCLRHAETIRAVRAHHTAMLPSRGGLVRVPETFLRALNIEPFQPPLVRVANQVVRLLYEFTQDRHTSIQRHPDEVLEDQLARGELARQKHPDPLVKPTGHDAGNRRAPGKRARHLS